MRLFLLVAVISILIGLSDRTTGQTPGPHPEIRDYYLLMTSPTLSASPALLAEIDFERLCRDASWVLVAERDSSAISAATVTGLIIHEVIKAPADSAAFKRIRCWNSPGTYWQAMDVLPATPKENRRFLLFARSKEGMLVPLEFGPHKSPAREDFIRKAREACGK